MKSSTSQWPKGTVELLIRLERAENATGQDAVLWAVDALLSNYDTPSLRVLAGLDLEGVPSAWKAKQLVIASLNELGITPPDIEGGRLSGKAFGDKEHNMTFDELQESWGRTTSFLRDARANVSEAGEGISADEIYEFEIYLEHYELELALDMLDEVVEGTGLESPHMIELMAKAALSMGLIERTRNYDKYLSELRGWEYRTKIE